MIVIIVGKAGVGKTTLRKALLETDNSLCKSISYTTRLPRAGEVDGVDYHFVSKEEFLSNKNILLKRQDTQNLYGVDKVSLQKKNVVMILDLNGIQEVSEYLPKEEIKIILLKAPLKILIDRLQKRGTSFQDIAKRLKVDSNLKKEEIQKRFPQIPLKIIDNSRPLSETVKESLKFIRSHLLINHKELIFNKKQKDKE